MLWWCDNKSDLIWTPSLPYNHLQAHIYICLNSINNRWVDSPKKDLSPIHFFMTLNACKSMPFENLKWRLTKEQSQNKGTFQKFLKVTLETGFTVFHNFLHSPQVFLCILSLFLSASDSPSRSTIVGLWVVTRDLRSDSFWSSLCLSSCTDSCTALIWCWNIAKPLNSPPGMLLWLNGAET